MSQLVAALIREYRQARDKAIFDAYQNGGEFEGKPVTDQALLDYIQQRRDMFTKDDPLWDQWNNTLIQQKFTIGESKSSLAYQEAVAKAKEAYDANKDAVAYNKALVSAAGDVAAFYKSALGSATPDSQFYRELEGKLAEWQARAADAQKAVDSSSAASGGSGGGSGGGGGGTSKASLTKTAQAAGDALQNSLASWLYVDQAIRVALSRAGYQLGPNDPVTAVGADVIQKLFASGSVGFGVDVWNQVATDLDAAYATAIDAYKAAGQNYVTLIKQKQDFDTETLTKIGSLDETVRAEVIYTNLQRALTDANGDPSLIAKAYADAKAGIGDLLSAATTAGADPDLIAALHNDYVGLDGGNPTGFGLIDLINEANAKSGQSPLEFGLPDKGVTSGAAQMSADVLATKVNQQLLASGQGYLVQSSNGSLTVVDSKVQPPGGLDPAYQQTVIVSGGQPVAAYLNGTPVYSTQTLDANGQPVDPRTAVAGGKQTETLIGYHYSYTLNGRLTEAWGIINPTGQITFVTKNPWLGLASEVRNGDGAVTRINVSTRTATGDVIEPGATIPSVVATATPSLVIDPAVTPLLRKDPTKAAELVNAGVISISTFATALTGSSAFITANPSATTDDVLTWMKTQQATSQDAGYLAQRAGERGTDTGGAPTTATATSLLSQQQYPGNLLQQRIYDALGLVAQNIINPLGTDRVTTPEAPPTYKGTDADFGPVASPTVSPYTGFTVAQPIATTAPAPTAPTGGTLVGGTVIYPTAPAPTTTPTINPYTGFTTSTVPTATISQPPTTSKTYSGGYSAI